MEKYNQIQYVIGKDDLRKIINEIIDERIALYEKQNEEKRNEELVPYERVMELLGVSKSTIWRWKQRGYLVPVRIGGNDRYRMSDIKKTMEG